MRRGSFIFTLALFAVSVFLLTATLAYPFKAKLFPLIILATVLTLIIIQIFREVFVLRKKSHAEREKEGSNRTKLLTVWVWMAGTVLMLWVVGFMGTVILLPFLYLRFERESWLLSINLALGCGVFFYGLFGFLLKMPLYPGVIIQKFFS